MAARLIVTNTETGRSFQYEIANDETRIGRMKSFNPTQREPTFAFEVPAAGTRVEELPKASIR